MEENPLELIITAILQIILTLLGAWIVQKLLLKFVDWRLTRMPKK